MCVCVVCVCVCVCVCVQRLTEVGRERSSAQRELGDKKEVSISCKTPTDRTKPCMVRILYSHVVRTLHVYYTAM